jgi:hypothetical protein
LGWSVKAGKLRLSRHSAAMLVIHLCPWAARGEG